MLKRWGALALLLLAVTACSGVGIQPCAGTPRESVGPCSVGAHHENSN